MTRRSLSQLLPALPEHRRLTDGDPAVQRVVCDSRQVRPGDLFVAVRGIDADGHQFVARAVAAGAAAVVVERPESVPSGTVAVQVPDGREAAALLAHEMAAHPTRTLTVLGVTGTNGKTTTTYLTRSILETAGRKTGVIGTISYQVGSRTIPAPTTTPGPVQLVECFTDMVASGMSAAVMEVSSHALDQRRTLGVEFRAAAFTNLTPEHLDYHRNVADYRQAKSRLFEQLAPDAVAVLNRDDEASEHFAAATKARVLWYSMKTEADIAAADVTVDLDGARFQLVLGLDRLPVQLKLIGRHNVYNAMAAAGLAMALGVPPQTIVRGLEALNAVPGRLEPVRCGQPFTVLVDYAHTDDALENSLSSVGPLKRGRLIVVFGCGGDRDRTKRPRMAAVAERWADLVIVTNDNPRTENPDTIADEVFAGFKSPHAVTRELDRGAAIHRAIEAARPGDVVVVAGKGHEDYQIVGTEKRHFDDREQARNVLTSLGYDAHVGDRA
ncbi:MAG: UDP-N-acetylmuramoyl-L-alanyl-D-glutamate--2,6-diaminopimelate ligase [Planctomycetes bacterium]|nr:UDP-N-acetylmuramoyl-L-alanyl-D-glutamate--2,6-diaminopimelate ligase [Planctomycetota bacterium]